MSSDSKAIFEAIQYARGEKGMPEKGDPMYWDDASGRCILNELAEFPGVSISNASSNFQDATITVVEPQMIESRRKRDFAARLSMFPKRRNRK
ncbi:unnamed protein product [Bathycoccus prasinos]